MKQAAAWWSEKNERRKISLPSSNLVYELLSPDMNRQIEFLLVRLAPGECTSQEKIRHAGEECGLVLKGQLIVRWGDQSFELEEGDSIYFASNIPHRYISIQARRNPSLFGP
jgi:quercetin dioxygenase-like cupin family protein